MSDLLEVLVTSDSNNTLWTCSVWNFHTGTSLMTYRGGGTAENKTLSFIGKDYIAAVEKTKPILHVWPLNSHQTIQGIRFVLPGKATAFSVSADGAYCIAGVDEKIYLWQIASGNLLTIINRHYQRVSLLKFTSNGKFFVSAAEDGMVMVWSLAAVASNPEVELVTQTTAGQHDPVYIFSDHSLPVTDFCLSKMGMHGRLFTVSSDRTSKIYDLSTGEMLLNLVFDEPLSSVTLDVLELNVFVGTSEGKIHHFSLTNPPRHRDLLINSEVNSPVFSGHSKLVNCLSVSLGGEVLVSGGDDGQVILWHIKSQQPIRIIKHKGCITNAFFSLNFDGIYKENFTPNIILHTLERSIETSTGEVKEIDVLVNKKINFWPAFTENSEENSLSNNGHSEELKNKEIFQNELEKMKAINANLYALSVQKTFDNVSLTNSTSKSNKKKKNRNKINSF